MFRIYIACLVVIFVGTYAGASELKAQVGFIKGFSWGWTGSRGEYLGERPERSLELLAATGTEWIALAFAAHMETKKSPEILYAEDNAAMVSDDEIRRAIQLARKHNFKVIMKPVVNCLDGAWRATIAFDGEPAWLEWWKHYEAFLVHYARIAAEIKCEMFCVGCEMRSSERFVARWRRAIGEVRKVYHGPIVYNANHDDVTRVQWFDAVDVIGVSGYYAVATKNDTSLDRMVTRWKPIRERLHNLSTKWKRPVLFIEIGVRSAATCSSMPWDFSHRELPYDGEEQARYYQAALQSFWNEPWFLGFCWWDWKAQLYDRDDGKTNTDFCVYGKPAEEVLSEWYHRQRPVGNETSGRAPAGRE